MRGWSAPITRETFVHHSGARNADEAREIANTLDLAPVLAKVHQPMLVVFGKLDRLFSYTDAERIAAQAPNARLVIYEEGNHVCNNIPYKYRPLVSDWMRQQLANVG
jgi:2,6-dihydroxypseudooxynicotine hydrolase